MWLIHQYISTVCVNKRHTTHGGVLHSDSPARVRWVPLTESIEGSTHQRFKLNCPPEMESDLKPEVRVDPKWCIRAPHLRAWPGTPLTLFGQKNMQPQRPPTTSTTIKASMSPIWDELWSDTDDAGQDHAGLQSLWSYTNTKHKKGIVFILNISGGQMDCVCKWYLCRYLKWSSSSALLFSISYKALICNKTMEACKWIPQGVSGFHSEQVFTATANLWPISVFANCLPQIILTPFGWMNYTDSMDRWSLFRP